MAPPFLPARPHRAAQRVQLCTSMWVFNRMQSYSGMAVIDARPAPDYAARRLVLAHSLPAPADALPDVGACHSPEEATQLLEALLARPDLSDSLRTALQRRRLATVVVYAHGAVGLDADDADDADDHDADAADAADDADADGEWALALAALLVAEQQCSAVCVLQDGFVGFAQRYPFLTTDEQPAQPFRLPLRAAVGFPNEIVPGFLYLGSASHASDATALRTLEITHCVNAANGVPNLLATADPPVQYLNVDVEDEESVDLRAHFRRVAEFVAAAKATPGARVLVHCRAGVSRSVSLVIYVLMALEQLSLARAFEHTVQCREVACPNVGFRRQLRQAELELHGTPSVADETFAPIVERTGSCTLL